MGLMCGLSVVVSMKSLLVISFSKELLTTKY